MSSSARFECLFLCPDKGSFSADTCWFIIFLMLIIPCVFFTLNSVSVSGSVFVHEGRFALPHQQLREGHCTNGLIVSPPLLRESSILSLPVMPLITTELILLIHHQRSSQHRVNGYTHRTPADFRGYHHLCFPHPVLGLCDRSVQMLSVIHIPVVAW